MDKSLLKIAWASRAAATYACEQWHYSKSLPTGKLAILGVWESEEFIGVVIFGRGTCGHLLKQYGLQPNDGCELVRVALTSHRSQVSRILSIAVKLLSGRFPKIRLIVSFAAMSQGHSGGIYKANGWIYAGKTDKKKEFLYKGRRTSDRSIWRIVSSKGVSRDQLELSGVIKLLDEYAKHRYLMPLDNEMRAKVSKLAKPYPTRMKLGDDCDQQDSDGSTPIHALQ